MPKLFMMVGLPGSGKSTIAQEIATSENATIHSSDALRKEMFGDERINDKNDIVFAELSKKIKNDLANNKNVIYDACNISYKRRKAFIHELKRIDCKKKAVIIATPYLKCIEQNKLRDRQVPEHVIKKMYLNFYIPQYYEGWDDIEIIYNAHTTRSYIITELLNHLREIDQENSYHTLTIGNHCWKCVEIIEQQVTDMHLSYAALLHDIGKEFTKEFKNAKGEITEEAHYYQHHLISAYNAMFYLRDIQHKAFNILETLALITWHMQPFNGIGAKFTKMVGEDFCDKLMVLHKADKMAK